MGSVSTGQGLEATARGFVWMLDFYLTVEAACLARNTFSLTARCLFLLVGIGSTFENVVRIIRDTFALAARRLLMRARTAGYWRHNASSVIAIHLFHRAFAAVQSGAFLARATREHCTNQ